MTKKALPLVLLMMAGVAAITTIMVQGYIKGRKEAADEAARGQPVKPPIRTKVSKDGFAQVSLSDKEQERIGLKIEGPKLKRVQKNTRAYGTVLDLANLTTLNNNIAAAQSQFDSAKAKLAASQPAFERAQTLLKSKTGTQVQVQIAEAAYLVDKASLAAAQSQVRALAATAIQDWGVVLGKALNEHDPLVNRLIERQTYLLQVTLPPAAVFAGPSGGAFVAPPVATIQVPGQTASIEAAYLSPATRTDPRIQGPSYFYLVPADRGVLPGMNLMANLASGPKVDVYVIPPSAIVWWSGRTWIYEHTGDDDFIRREIHLDGQSDKSGSYLVAIKALPGNDPEIVTTAAQLLLSEEFRSQIEVGGDND